MPQPDEPQKALTTYTLFEWREPTCAAEPCPLYLQKAQFQTPLVCSAGALDLRGAMLQAH